MKWNKINMFLDEDFEKKCGHFGLLPTCRKSFKCGTTVLIYEIYVY